MGAKQNGRSWPKAEWQLSGDKKRKRTFDSHECRTAKFELIACGREALSRRELGTRRSVDWRLAGIVPSLIDEDAVQAQSRIIQLGGRSCI